MPKVRPLTDTARDKEAFNRVLDIKRASAGIPNWAALADGLGIDRNVLYSWRHDPGSIPRRKLRKLYQYLKYTPEDMYASFGFGQQTS